LARITRQRTLFDLDLGRIAPPASADSTPPGSVSIYLVALEQARDLAVRRVHLARHGAQYSST
jgi:hypothetical protein